MVQNFSWIRCNFSVPRLTIRPGEWTENMKTLQGNYLESVVTQLFMQSAIRSIETWKREDLNRCKEIKIVPQNANCAINKLRNILELWQNSLDCNVNSFLYYIFHSIVDWIPFSCYFFQTASMFLPLNALCVMSVNWMCFPVWSWIKSLFLFSQIPNVCLRLSKNHFYPLAKPNL